MSFHTGEESPERLRDMALFERVARLKSFSGAAQALAMAPSSLSQRISGLEKALGVRLLNRTTRKVDLTSAGAEFLQHCARMLDEARLAHEALQAQSARPRGLLRVSMPVFLALELLGPALEEFARRYPEIRIDLDLSPRRADLVSDGIDLAVRAGELPDSALVGRRLASLPRALFASPGYLRRAGQPADAQALAQHECIVGTGGANWTLTRGRTAVQVAVRGRYGANNAAMNRELAVRGMGIAMLPQCIVAAQLGSGALRAVLPGWTPPPTLVTAVTATRLLPARTRVFLDFLGETLA